MVFQFLITKGIRTDCSSTLSDGTIYKRNILKTEQSCLPPLHLEKNYSLSQNGWDTLESPCPVNVGVQDLVNEPR